MPQTQSQHQPSKQRTKLDERVRTRHSRDGIAPVASTVVAREFVHKARVDLFQVQKGQSLGETAVRERQVAHAVLQQVATSPQLRLSASASTIQKRNTAYWKV